jgi:hypothetical protein
MFSSIEWILILYPVIMIFFVIGTFGWVWAIATNLNAQLPEGVKLNVKLFKGVFLFPNLYILLLVIFMGFSFVSESSASSNESLMIAIILPLHLISMVCIFWGLLFAAKTMKTVEIGRKAKFSDYAGEFFLIWFSIIGYWILQPRLNKLIDK